LIQLHREVKWCLETKAAWHLRSENAKAIMKVDLPDSCKHWLNIRKVWLRKQTIVLIWFKLNEREVGLMCKGTTF